MKLGAYDYLAKPYRMAEIDVLVRRAWEKRQLARENALLQSRLVARRRRAARSSRSTRRCRPCSRSSSASRTSDSPVLITGESGTGKELVARVLHRLSGRANGALVDINCAAIAENLLESELFGHEKGAFTGALTRKLGLIELAAGGTLFLDEIGELDPRSCRASCCARSSRRSFFRVGGTQKVEVDVRIVAATNRDLRASGAEGSFRDDLLLSHQHDRHHAAAAARARGRHPAARASIPQAVRRRDAADAHRRGDRSAPALPLAGQHARAAERDRARGAARARWPQIRAVRPARCQLPSARRAARRHDGAGAVARRARAPAHRDRAAQTNWHQGTAATRRSGITSKTLYRKIREYGFRRPGGACE